MSEPLETQEQPSQPEPAAPAVEYARAEDFKRLEATIAGQQELITSLNATIQAAIRSNAAPAPRADAAGPSDEELDRMLDDGRITAAQHSREVSKRALAAFKASDVDPLRDTGLGAVAATTKQLAIGMRDDRGEPLMPYYKKYQKEIDSLVDGLPAASKLSPDAYLRAHAMVVGQHMSEIVEETREATVRAATAPKPETAAPTTRTGRNTRTDQVPTVEELMGKNAADALESKGLSPDQLAQRLGYKGGWTEYVKLAQTGAV